MRATRKNALLLVAVLILMISQVPITVSNDCALAESEAYDYSQIWESFGVNSSEEMYEETLAYLRSQNPGAWAITKEYLPCNIRYGGTTEELLADWKNWDLAVVSSKDVDLRALVERKDLIEKFPVSLEQKPPCPPPWTGMAPAPHNAGGTALRPGTPPSTHRAALMKLI